MKRSYEADEWLRSDEAIEVAAEAGKDCELCLGFSQGAMLLAVLLSEGKLPSEWGAARECPAKILTADSSFLPPPPCRIRFAPCEQTAGWP